MTPEQHRAIADARRSLEASRARELSQDDSFWAGWLDSALVSLLRAFGEDVPAMDEAAGEPE